MSTMFRMSSPPRPPSARRSRSSAATAVTAVTLAVLAAPAFVTIACVGIGCSGSTPESVAAEPITIDAWRAAVIVDVRTADEHAEGHLANDHNIPVDELAGRIAEIDALALHDRSRPIFVYCRSGNRSGRARRMLQDRGFTNVVNAGGFASIVEQFPGLRAP